MPWCVNEWELRQENNYASSCILLCRLAVYTSVCDPLDFCQSNALNILHTTHHMMDNVLLREHNRLHRQMQCHVFLWNGQGDLRVDMTVNMGGMSRTGVLQRWALLPVQLATASKHIYFVYKDLCYGHSNRSVSGDSSQPWACFAGFLRTLLLRVMMLKGSQPLVALLYTANDLLTHLPLIHTEWSLIAEKTQTFWINSHELNKVEN